jgi:cytochrome P450
MRPGLQEPVRAFDPDAPEIIADPYPVYDRLRAEDPVHFNPKGFWFLSRYDDVAAALRDPRFSNRPAPFALLHARHRARFIASDVAANLVAFHDAPEHTEIRRPLASAFGKRLRRIEADVATIAAEAAGQVPAGQGIDAVSRFAAPCALRTTARMIGLPEADLPRIAGWSSDFFFMFHAIPDAETMARLNESVAAFRAYVTRLIAHPPAEGLIADLADATEEADHTALADNIMLLIADGIENVRAGLASALDIILRHPACLDRVRQNPDALDRAIEEALRLESPGQYQGRITLEPVEIGGRKIRSRAIVLLGYGAANRDPARFDAPDSFDIDRPPHRTMTFGMGPHACLGTALVRVQARAALAALLARDVRLTAPDAARDWVPRAGHRWLASLPVEIAA